MYYNCLYFTISEAVVIAQELNIDTEVCTTTAFILQYMKQ